MKRTVTEMGKRILLIGEKPDIELFTALQQEGYEVVALESPYKAWGVQFLYRPHFIVVHLHHPSRKDVAMLQDCLALADRVPLIVATSVLGDKALMKDLQRVATSFVFLPLKPNALREVFDELESSLNDKWSW